MLTKKKYSRPVKGNGTKVPARLWTVKKDQFHELRSLLNLFAATLQMTSDRLIFLVQRAWEDSEKVFNDMVNHLAKIGSKLGSTIDESYLAEILKMAIRRQYQFLD
jgi:hypothetical protein